MTDRDGEAQPRLEVLEGGRDSLEREIATALFTPDGVPQARSTPGTAQAPGTAHGRARHRSARATSSSSMRRSPRRRSARASSP